MYDADRYGKIGDKCRKCGVSLDENNASKSFSRKWCQNCVTDHVIKKHPKRNAKRMYVNGKYISTTHPLYKPGRYKTFNDAAFSSLENFEKSKEGEVYIISNPAWSDWYKVGKAIDSTDRCNAYQTGSPHRDYKLITSKAVSDRNKAERDMHKIVEKICEKRSNEWFYVLDLTEDKLNKLLEMLND